MAPRTHTPQSQSSAPHTADSHDLIRVPGARENNLKDVGIEIPKRRLTVFTTPALMSAHTGEWSVRHDGTGATPDLAERFAETAACTAPHRCGTPTPQGLGKSRVDGGR